MGKPLKQQRAGKGSISFRSPSHRFVGPAKYGLQKNELMQGTITDIENCPGHTAPLVRIQYEDGEKILTIAPEGVKVGDSVTIGPQATLTTGSTIQLKDIPEGTYIYNIELRPGDGGKIARSSGTAAKVLTRSPTAVTVMLPSKKEKQFQPNCRATIGNVAGSGRTEKPLLKAGNAFHKHHARNRWWPIVAGLAMNAVDHPFGGKRGSRKGKPNIAPKNAPPGRKVGKIRPRQTGKFR